MKRLIYSSLVALTAMSSPAVAGPPILQPGDFSIAIDVDVQPGASNHPAGEPAIQAVDGIGNVAGNKYLNFGKRNTGFIATPSVPSIVQSLALTTAGDADVRDPIAYAVYGTNDPITSIDNSTGSAESWALISEGAIATPTTRNTLAPIVSFPNATAYNSYRVVFPEIRNFRNANSMQVAELGLFTSNDGSGSSVFSTLGSPDVLAIQLPFSNAFSPAAEGADKLFDSDPGTKYLNFGKENSGFIVTPASGASIIDSFQISTANDSPSRDPSSWVLYGTNDSITSANFSWGDKENWIEIDSGTVDLPLDRSVLGPIVDVDNNASYTSYRMIFPTQRDPLAGDADSMQYSDIQFFAVPEPSTLAMGMLGLVAAGCIRRKHS